MIPYKVFWSALAFILTGGATALPNFLDTPPWLPVPITVILALLWSACAVRVVHKFEGMFWLLPWRGRAQILSLIRVAAGLHVAWSVAVCLAPNWWIGWSVALSGLALIEVLVAMAHPYWLTTQRPVVDEQKVEAAALGIDPNDPVGSKMILALKGAGIPHVDVIRWEPVGDAD